MQTTSENDRMSFFEVVCTTSVEGFGVVHGSVNTGFFVVLCTNVAFVRTPLHQKEGAGWSPKGVCRGGFF